MGRAAARAGRRLALLSPAMKLAGWLVVVGVAAQTACACKGSGSGGGTGPGTGTGSGTGVDDASACDGQAEHVRGLYEAAAARVPTGTPMPTATATAGTEVADNVAMVMAECKAAPARVVPCLREDTADAQLERTCLAPLDDEGREGQIFRDLER